MTAEMDDESGLQQAAQGVEAPTVKSGIHAQTIVQEALKAVTNLKDNAGDYYIRLNQIVLQLTRAYCTVPQLMQFKGKDGEFKAKEFARTDFRNTRVVSIARGSFTMHTLLAKQEAANNAFDRKVIDAEEYAELTSGNISPVLANQENPHLLRIRRQVDVWRDGMPPEWPQAMQEYQLQMQQFQQVQQQQQMAQQQAAQLQQQGIPVPAPQPAAADAAAAQAARPLRSALADRRRADGGQDPAPRAGEADGVHEVRLAAARVAASPDRLLHAGQERGRHHDRARRAEAEGRSKRPACPPRCRTASRSP
jgi:hypothetical protein